MNRTTVDVTGNIRMKITVVFEQKQQMSSRKFPLYDTYVLRMKELGYREYNALEEAGKITTLLRKLPKETSQELAKLIFVFIIHHERVTGHGHRISHVPYNGRKLPKNKGIIYAVKDRLPPFLVQIIFTFVNDVVNGTVPPVV